MLERGNEDFTLQEVSRLGDVSIGSIYLRFESKENLVRAVIARELEQIVAEEAEMVDLVSAKSSSLAEFLCNYIDAYAEYLKHRAPLIRLSMERATHDPLIAGPGKETAMRSAQFATQGMLAYRNEFGGDDCELRARSAYATVFAALGRHLSLGLVGDAALPSDWEQIKHELTRMCVAYLTYKG